MATAYAPGLTVTARTLFRKERRLPIKGDVIVEKGQKVTAEDIVARTDLPGKVFPVNVVQKLNIPPADVNETMVVQQGNFVKQDEPIATCTSFFGLFTNHCLAPVSGTIESISEVTGQVMMRAAPIPVELTAFFDGTIVEIVKDEGVVVETEACFIQGIFGIGGETVGTLVSVAKTPDDVLEEKLIEDKHKGKIIFGGSLVTAEAIKKAVETGVKGIIAGGIDANDLKDFLGYDLGVAITGNENKGITIILTEGFGPIRMAEKTFKLLSDNVDKKCSINGATQIRAGVMRPEIIIPLEKDSSLKEKTTTVESSGAMEVGSQIRIIREPNFGELATVKELPVELTVLPTEARVRVVTVTLKRNGEDTTIPRANVEIIEG
jgi:hypothetical protein